MIRNFSPAGVLASGFTGTLALTGIVYGLPLLGIHRIDIIDLLGALVTRGLEPSAVVGGFLHFLLGWIFAASYAGLWRVGIGRPTVKTGLLFGFLHGLVAIAALQVIYALAPYPPPLYMTGIKSLTLLIGHLFYGVLVAVVYRPFVEDPRRVPSASH